MRLRSVLRALHSASYRIGTIVELIVGLIVEDAVINVHNNSKEERTPGVCTVTNIILYYIIIRAYTNYELVCILCILRIPTYFHPNMYVHVCTCDLIVLE